MKYWFCKVLFSCAFLSKFQSLFVFNLNLTKIKPHHSKNHKSFNIPNKNSTQVLYIYTHVHTETQLVRQTVTQTLTHTHTHTHTHIYIYIHDILKKC